MRKINKIRAIPIGGGGPLEGRRVLQLPAPAGKRRIKAE